jgi:hypothetical protein
VTHRDPGLLPLGDPEQAYLDGRFDSLAYRPSTGRRLTRVNANDKAAKMANDKAAKMFGKAKA